MNIFSSNFDFACPHCDTRHQTNLHYSSILLLFCPVCEGHILIYSRQCFALNEQIMTHGSREDKIEYLTSIITDSVRQKFMWMLCSMPDSESGQRREDSDLFDPPFNPEDPNDPQVPIDPDEPGSAEYGHDRPTFNLLLPDSNWVENPIQPDEVESFKSIDLKLIDNADYFKTVFDL